MSSPRPEILLASASPRRHELLAATGLPFRVVEADFEESTVSHLGPRRLALLAAEGKCRSAVARHPQAWVVGADTVVAVDGQALGKPLDRGDAARMLRLLSGRSHSVLTGVCVFAPATSTFHRGVALSRVRFRRLTAAQVAAYVAGGEPMDKAGAYGIQGGAADFARVERGALDNVVGLPIHLLSRLLREAGYPAGKAAAAGRHSC